MEVGFTQNKLGQKMVIPANEYGQPIPQSLDLCAAEPPIDYSPAGGGPADGPTGPDAIGFPVGTCRQPGVLPASVGSRW